MTVESFIPKLWASALQVPFQENLVYGNPAIANTRFQPMLQNNGRSVSINTIGAAKIKDHDRTKDLEYDDIDTTEVELVMDQEKYYGFNVNDVDKVQAAGDFQSASTALHGAAMASTVDAYLGAQLAKTAGKKLGNKAVFNGADFYRPGTGQTTAFDLLADIALEMDNLKIPTTSRWAVLPTDYANALLRDARVTKAHAAGTDQVLRNGIVGTVDTLGFTIYTSVNAPKTSTRGTIIAGVPGVLDFATQLQKIEAFRNPNRFGDVVRGLQVFGAVVSNPNGLVTAEADVKAGTLGTSPAA